LYSADQFASISNITRNSVLYASNPEHDGSITVTDDGVQTTVTIYPSTRGSTLTDELQVICYNDAPGVSPGPAANVAVTNFPISQNINGAVTVNGEVEVKNDTGNPLAVSVGNFPATQAVTGTFFQATQPVSGSVTVSNFPASQAVTGTFFQAIQPVSGSVSVSNFPATQPVSGSVTVSNFPATQAVTGTFFQATQPVSGSVSVSNLPATQPISGSVTVSNFPATQAVTGTFFQATQPVSGSVTVSNFPATQPVSGAVSVSNFPASQAVTGTFFQATQPVSGTVTANQGTSPWVVSGSVTTTPSATAQTVTYSTADANNQLDTLGRLKVSTQAQQYWYAPNVDKDGDIRYIETFTGTGATSNFVQHLAAVYVTSGLTSSGYTIRASRRRHKLRTGITTEWFSSHSWDGTQTGVTKRRGLFTQYNGVFWEVTDDLYLCLRRRLVNGTLVETRIPRSQFTIDKLDGTGLRKEDSTSHFHCFENS
jgi:hypothetical protein